MVANSNDHNAINREHIEALARNIPLPNTINRRFNQNNHQFNEFSTRNNEINNENFNGQMMNDGQFQLPMGPVERTFRSPYITDYDQGRRYSDIHSFNRVLLPSDLQKQNSAGRNNGTLMVQDIRNTQSCYGDPERINGSNLNNKIQIPPAVYPPMWEQENIGHTNNRTQNLQDTSQRMNNLHIHQKHRSTNK